MEPYGTSTSATPATHGCASRCSASPDLATIPSTFPLPHDCHSTLAPPCLGPSMASFLLPSLYRSVKTSTEGPAHLAGPRQSMTAREQIPAPPPPPTVDPVESAKVAGL